MEDTEAIERELIGLIRRWTRRQPITPQSAFYQDLYVVGDDLEEFLLEIIKRYRTSFEGFRLKAYVPDELTAGAYWCAMRLGFCKDSFPRLTIEHLANVVQHGKWFAPKEPHRPPNSN